MKTLNEQQKKKVENRIDFIGYAIIGYYDEEKLTSLRTLKDLCNYIRGNLWFLGCNYCRVYLHASKTIYFNEWSKKSYYICFDFYEFNYKYYIRVYKDFAIKYLKSQDKSIKGVL